MTDSTNDILIIGYGNPGRQDDGLGPALAEAIDQLNLPNVTVDSDYQLTVEHAEMAAHYAVVIFADATQDNQEPFSCTRIEPGPPALRFTSHHLTPQDVLALTRDLFAAQPTAYLLAIRGHRFGELELGLSPNAQAALEGAVDFLTTKILDNTKDLSSQLITHCS